MALLRGRKKRTAAAAPAEPETPTRIIREKIGHCEDIQEYNALVQQYAQHYVPWSEHICQLLCSYGIRDTELAKALDTSPGTIANFKKMIPTKRDDVIKIAMYIGLTAEQTNDLLSRWAKFSRLYAKNPQDALWIYLLDKGGSKTPGLLFDAYMAVYEEEKARYCNRTAKYPEAIRDTHVLRREIDQYAVASCTRTAEADITYREMVRRHMPEYFNAHRKLMDHLNRQMNLLLQTEESAHKLFRNNAYFHSQYYRRMQELREEHRLPSRTFLIALALHMNMEAHEIDKLLDLAGMAPLCAKDRLDSAIVFYLEEQYCEFPSRFFNINKLRDDTDYYNLHDSSDGNHEERISSYIKRQLQELTIDDPDEQRRAKALLKML